MHLVVAAVVVTLEVLVHIVASGHSLCEAGVAGLDSHRSRVKELDCGLEVVAAAGVDN